MCQLEEKNEAMLASIGFDGSPCLAHGPLASLSPHREKGMPSCPAYGVVRGFFSVVVLMWLHVPDQTNTVAVQQYIPLCPHNMPCITTVMNIEKISVQWVVPTQQHVSTAVSSTHCKPQKCDMLKEPLPMNPLKAECLPP